MNINTFLFSVSAFLYFSFYSPLVIEVQAQNPLRGAKVCINNDRGTVVIRRRCPTPKFTQVTPEALADATTLGGVSAEKYLSNFIVVNESFPLTLSPGGLSGNSASCPEGYIVTGGGVSIINNNGLVITRSIPSTSLSFWSGSVRAFSPPYTGTMSIYAICGLGERFIEDDDE